MKNVEIEWAGSSKKYTYAKAIPIGSIFAGQIGTYDTRLFVRTLNHGIIALDGDHAGDSWAGDSWGGDPGVADYQAIHKITVDAEKPE